MQFHFTSGKTIQVKCKEVSREGLCQSLTEIYSKLTIYSMQNAWLYMRHPYPFLSIYSPDKLYIYYQSFSYNLFTTLLYIQKQSLYNIPSYPNTFPLCHSFTFFHIHFTKFLPFTLNHIHYTTFLHIQTHWFYITPPHSSTLFSDYSFTFKHILVTTFLHIDTVSCCIFSILSPSAHATAWPFITAAFTLEEFFSYISNWVWEVELSETHCNIIAWITGMWSKTEGPWFIHDLFEQPYWKWNNMQSYTVQI